MSATSRYKGRAAPSCYPTASCMFPRQNSDQRSLWGPSVTRSQEASLAQRAMEKEAGLAGDEPDTSGIAPPLSLISPGHVQRRAG